MKTKAKKFSHKLLALFMAVLMAASCFTGALTAYADTMSSEKTYADESIEYNDLAWAILSDEQVATALLDYADLMLAQYGPQIDKLLENLPSSITQYITWDSNSRTLKLNAFGLVKKDIPVRTHSVDELFYTLRGVADLLNSYGNLLGDAGNLNFKAVATKDWNITRETASSTDILRSVIGILQNLSCDYNGSDILGQVLRGNFTLGTLGNVANLDVYKIVGNLLGFTDTKYKTNLVYNVAQNLIFQYTNWYTEEEINNFKNGTATWVYDDQLINKLTTELLDKISVLVTYNQEYTDADSQTAIQDTSATRYLKIKAEMKASGSDYATAAAKLGYDPNLVYSDEFKDDEGNPLNVLLFAYGAPDENGYATESTTKVTLKATDNLFDFSYRALDLAWDTVLKGTVKLLHVNDGFDKGHGANFDNNYYYFFDQKGEWNDNDVAANYTPAKLNQWANAVYKDYKFDTADDFLAYVKKTVTYDRTAAEDSTGSWKDIDATRLFAKLRYSPLADYGFNVTTGPINLYFAETGTPNLDKFFSESYSKYSSMVAGFNDALVAAVKDLFPQRGNVIGTRPEMTTTGDFATIDAAAIKSIVSTLVGNACKMVQYTADATDANILKAFYAKNGASAALTEKNLEEAMIPMLVACIGQVNLGSGKLEKIIHPSDWDGCKDAEAVAYVCLKEYLSYSMPNKDYSKLVKIGSDGTINATLEGTILPMARDAVAYVIEAYVPLEDENGNTWKTESAAVDSKTTLFDLLNSVVCYYGGDHAMEKAVNKGERAMGVGALLGICDGNGNSLITTKNTLWENINAIANKLMPVLGTLQGTGYAKFNSEELIWNNIVLSFLDIGKENSKTGLCGVSNFLNQLFTIVSAEPIQKTSFVVTVYDLLKDLINGLFGARYSGQSFKTIVPDATSAHPFDDFFQVKVLAGTSGKDLGAFQKLICNFVEFGGYGTNGPKTYSDSIIRGICFAVQAVNSFIPNALTTLGQHQLKMATASFGSNTVTGCISGQPYDDALTVTNNSVGINASYIKDGKPTQLSRYYVKITSVLQYDVYNEEMPDDTIDFPETPIDPGKSAKINISVPFDVSGSDTTNTCRVVVNYDIVDDQGNVLYGGNTVTAYKLLTSEVSFRNALYDADYNFNSTFQQTDGTDREENGVTVHSLTGIGGNISANYPDKMVIASNKLNEIAQYSFFMKGGSKEKSIDGVFFFDRKSGYESNNLTTAAKAFDDSNLTTVDIGENNAIARWDKSTGDLLKIGMYDYRVETSAGSGEFGEWQRNHTNGSTGSGLGAVDYYRGYTSEEIGNISKQNEGKEIETRTHVAFTLQEALDAKIIAGYHINESGIYDTMYLKTGGKYNYDNIFNMVTLGTGIDAIYINTSKQTFGSNAVNNYRPFGFDGEATVKTGTYDVNVNFYNSGSYKTGSFQLVIGESGSAGSLDKNYNELANIMANYKTSDFKEDASIGSVYDLAKDALMNVLSVQSAPYTAESALTQSDKTEYAVTTSVTTSATGDRAYVPYSTSNETVTFTVKGTQVSYTIPESVKATAYVGGTIDATTGVTSGGVKGIYYSDEKCTMPIYSPKPLTSSDVKNGKDAALANVTLGQDGNYYLTNSVKYATKWDLDTYPGGPWQRPTTTQDTNKDNEPLYNQVQYVYRNSEGKKCNSGDNWACKFPSAEYQLIPNSGEMDSVDNRGIATQANDRLEYVLSVVKSHLISSSSTLYNEISELRNGLEEINFDILTYNKMVEYAKKAEQQYTVDVDYVDATTGKTVERNGMSYVDAAKLMNDLKNAGTKFTYTTASEVSSVQAKEYVKLFNIFASAVIERGYQGKQLENEIKCASGNAYSMLKATPATYNEDGTVATEATVSKNGVAANPRFGSFDASGKLVNEGATKYSSASWNRYVRALAAAVDLANYGNGSYKYKNSGTFNINDRKNYDAQLAKIYNVDTELQAAEIGLTEFESCELTVTPVAGAKVTIDGVAYSGPVAVEKGQVVSINVTAEEGYTLKPELTVNGDKLTFDDTATAFPYELTVTGNTTIVPSVESLAPSTHSVNASLVVATSSKGATNNKGVNGTYKVTVYDSANAPVLEKSFDLTTDANEISLDLAPGTYTVTITSEFALARTVSIVVGDADIAGPAIAMVVCDYNKDGNVTGEDATAVYSVASKAADLRYDLNGDGSVTGADATTVYAIASSAIALPAVTIK
jgi:hypothetical protein